MPGDDLNRRQVQHPILPERFDLLELKRDCVSESLFNGEELDGGGRVDIPRRPELNDAEVDVGAQLDEDRLLTFEQQVQETDRWFLAGAFGLLQKLLHVLAAKVDEVAMTVIRRIQMPL